VTRGAYDALLAAFAGTYSLSLQQTLYAIGERIIAQVPQVCEVRLALPNRHHFLFDLEQFGLTNENEVYFAADRPYGLIEGTVLADDAPAPGLAWD
jgi:urate oxidase